MAKKKTETRDDSSETIAREIAEAINQPPSTKLTGPWGYGFEKNGTKWRAYKTQQGTTTYLTPSPGRELHHVVTQIQQALAQEVATATRRRG